MARVEVRLFQPLVDVRSVVVDAAVVVGVLLLMYGMLLTLSMLLLNSR